MDYTQTIYILASNIIILKDINRNYIINNNSYTI